MTAIKWSLDKTDPIDLIDPLGSIEIVDSHGKSIRESVTYVDSWFDALIRGIAELASGSKADIDLFDEPKHLIFSTTEGEVTLTYGSEQIRVGSLSEFRATLHDAAVQFIDELREYGNVNEKRNLQHVVSWLSK